MIARLRRGQNTSGASGARLEHILASLSKCPHSLHAKTHLQACKRFQIAENPSRHSSQSVVAKDPGGIGRVGAEVQVQEKKTFRTVTSIHSISINQPISSPPPRPR